MENDENVDVAFILSLWEMSTRKFRELELSYRMCNVYHSRIIYISLIQGMMKTFNKRIRTVIT